MEESQAVPVGFPSTLWSLVHDAGGGRDAMGRLIVRYWKSVYWYVRLSANRDAATAMDLTQSFFLHVLESGFASKADPGRGRFRTFLKSSLANFLTDQFRGERTQRRGGPAIPLPTEGTDLESAELLAAGRELGPEQVFDREWCATVYRRAVDETRRRCAAEGRERHFEAFRLHDLEGEGRAKYRDVAERLGISENDVRNHLHAARETFRDCLRSEIRETVGSPLDFKDELCELFSWLK